jgi:NitT/TauT family transport system substrate-binding protein
MKKNNRSFTMTTAGTMKNIMLMLGFFLLLPCAATHAQKTAVKKATFLPLWVPQPQFAGYYMAKEKGIYEKYGLDVTIMNGGYEHDVTASLKRGEIDFGVLFLYTGVMERAQGTKLVNIGQIFQRSGIMFAAKKTSGIQTLKDFNGKKIGVWRSVAKELTAGFLKKHGIEAEIVPFNTANNVLLQDAVDISVMMHYNEYKTLINSGINPDEIATFYFNDYGLNFPEDGIYCMETTLKADPERCRKFVGASIEGWTYALAHPEETLEVKWHERYDPIVRQKSPGRESFKNRF